jgi:hypothetical protein
MNSVSSSICKATAPVISRQKKNSNCFVGRARTIICQQSETGELVSNVSKSHFLSF